MAQSVLLSTVESALNSASALALGFLMNWLVLPVFDLHPSAVDSLKIAIVFFFASVLRNLAWRRFFEAHQSKGE